MIWIDEEEFNKKLGAALREIRKSEHMTQEQVAQKLGVSKMTISHWERGDRAMLAKDLKRFCEVMDVSVQYVFNIPEE